MDDSIRNERVRMRTADLALCYQQDSTVMAQKVFIREKENEVLELRQKSGVCIKIVDNGETGCEVTFLLPDKYDYRI